MSSTMRWLSSSAAAPAPSTAARSTDQGGTSLARTDFLLNFRRLCRHTFSKVLSAVTSYRKCKRALTLRMFGRPLITEACRCGRKRRTLSRAVARRRRAQRSSWTFHSSTASVQTSSPSFTRPWRSRTAPSSRTLPQLPSGTSHRATPLPSGRKIEPISKKPCTKALTQRSTTRTLTAVRVPGSVLDLRCLHCIGAASAPCTYTHAHTRTHTNIRM